MDNHEDKTRVIVVGAGPAGSVCAYLLLKSGIDVVLLDHAKFPRDKICGGGLTYKAYHFLEQVYPNLHYDYNSVNHIRVWVNNKHTCEIDAKKEIRIVERKVFDHQLLKEYVQAGGCFVNEGLKEIREEKDGRIVVTLSNGDQLWCDYLVGADGANSRVRKYLNPKPNRKMLIMEQYMEKGAVNEIGIGLSKHYDKGYYYRFPNNSFDAVGYCDLNNTADKFRAVLKENGLEETRLKGAFITISTDYPVHNHIILIGDAGGFSNRLTYEGLFYAFQSAKNACDAIVSRRTFKETNSLIFKKKRHEQWKTRLFYSRFGLGFSGFCCRWSRLVKFVFDKNV